MADDDRMETPAAGESQVEPYVFQPADTAPGEGKAVQNYRALLQRPTISIRTRIILSFSLIFILCAAIAIWTFYTVTVLQDSLTFVELADSYMSEIQQARRFEKNYLLYGTNLEDANEHVQRAEWILESNWAAMATHVGVDKLKVVASHVQDYEDLLYDLGQAETPAERMRIETSLREHGSHMVSFALDLATTERRSIEKTFELTRRVPLLFLVVLVLVMVLISGLLSRQLIGSLSRFTVYAERIGAGDFSPVTPVRRYRDEFSQLALAFNHMIDELDRRHAILVESHKIRAIGNLVAGVAHELNNPLNNIFLSASCLLEDYDELDDDERVDIATDVMKEAERSQHIVRNLLDFARESETRMEPIHLDELLQRSVGLVGNQVRMARIDLDVLIPGDLPPIHGDAQMLSQVFVNLLLNAIDVLPPGGHITLSVSKEAEKGYLSVALSDDGPGIPEHVLPRIFEPFFTTKDEGKGTGLGLSVSRGIIRKLGGTIRVTSEEGVGTTFTVLLPKTEIPFEKRG